MGDVPLLGNRPDVLYGATDSERTPCGEIYVTINVNDEGVPYEMRLEGMGKQGGCVRSMIEVIGTLASKSLEEGVPFAKVLKRFDGVGCSKAPPPTANDPGGSCIHKISIGAKKAYESALMGLYDRLDEEAKKRLPPLQLELFKQR